MPEGPIGGPRPLASGKGIVITMNINQGGEPLSPTGENIEADLREIIDAPNVRPEVKVKSRTDREVGERASKIMIRLEGEDFIYYEFSDLIGYIDENIAQHTSLGRSFVELI